MMMMKLLQEICYQQVTQTAQIIESVNKMSFNF